jgi:phosphatidylinositol alpha-1,6-mannosyltransferase
MRVLFVSRKWPPAVGGMETYSAELTSELAHLVDLDLRVLPGRSTGYPPSAVQLAWFILSTGAFLWRHRGRYDLVHFGDVVLFPLAWLHAKCAPNASRVITVHGLDLTYGRRKGAAPAIYRAFLRWAVRRGSAAQAYLANSQNTARLAEGAGFRPARAVPLGVRPTTDAPYSCPAELPPYLLFVGRLVRRKGAAWFAEHVLPRLPPDLELRVVGKSWDQVEVATLRANPRVRILGYLPDEALNEQRRRSVAVIMPNIPSPDETDVEGFGLTALEPAANGVPILAAALEGLVDAVRNDCTGYLIPPEQPEAWAAKVVDVLGWSAERRTRFAAAAWRTLTTEFAWARVARDTLQCYEYAIARGVKDSDRRPAE